MTFLDTLSRWICCRIVDDEEVVSLVRAVRRNPDQLAEDMVLYTHDPVVRHVTNQPSEVIKVDNVAEEKKDEQPAKIETTRVRFPRAGDAEPVVPPPSVDITPIMFGDIQCDLVVGGKYYRQPITIGTIECAQVVNDVTEQAMVARVEAPPQQEQDVQENLPVVEGPSSVYRVCQDVVEVARHRRLPHNNRDYVGSVVSEIKNRLGCPAANAANLLVVRRMGNNIMMKHGVRPSHIRNAIELVVAGVFVPDENDLLGAKVLASVSVSSLRAEVADAGPKNAWKELFAKVFNPFARRGASRVRAGV